MTSLFSYDSTYSFKCSVAKTRPQKAAYVPLYTFRKSLYGMQRLGFKSPCIASSARLDGIQPVQIHLIGIRDSPYHRSVRNKEVKFI